MVARRKTPEDMVTEILTRSRRRCCICYGLHRDGEIKQGQIAHLDQDNRNNRPDNLAFLCLQHHDAYDSKTSQSKGFTIGEIKAYRDELYSHMQKLALKNVIVPASSMFSEREEEEALRFHTSTHRSQSAVLLVADGPKTIEEINEAILPSDLEWTRSILTDVIQSGWVRGMPTDYGRFELSMNGRRMLEVLSLLPDELKENAWRAVWLPEQAGG
jgi:hypothetical protein